MADAKRDQNFVTTLLAVSSVDGVTPVPVYANPTTHRLLVDLPGGTGTVTDVSVVSANGFAGSVATATSTPAITLSTTITGILKGNGTAISAAVAGDVDTILPTQTGNNGKYLTTNGTNSSWATIAGGGDVTKVGTPVNNQIGVWTGDGTLEGDSALTFDTATDTLTSVLFAGALNGTVGATTPTTGVFTTATVNTGLVPDANDGAYLGQAGTAFSDLFLASGAVINFDSSNYTITHASNLLTFSTSVNGANQFLIQNTNALTTGAYLELYHNSATPATGDTSGVEFTANNASVAKTIQAAITSQWATTTAGAEDGLMKFMPTSGGVTYTDGAGLTKNEFYPLVSDGLALGSTSNQFSDLFLATGAVINFNNGNVTLTQSSGTLTMARASDLATGPVYELYHDSATPAAADIIGEIAFFGRDSAANKQQYGRIMGAITDTTSTSEDGRLAFGVVTAGTLANELELIGSALYPTTNDGLALGLASTGEFSDLFLAEGGVINFDNGDLTLTQSGNSLTLAGGDLVLAENTSIQLDPSLSADGTYSGTTITGTAGATLAFGDVVYLAAADSRWELTDADAASTSGSVLVGICVQAAAADGNATTILLQGNIRADAAFPALTISAPVYISTTAGDITQTAPNATDDVVRVLGFALTADSMYFNPSPDYVTIV
jgi:hypothetical protein